MYKDQIWGQVIFWGQAKIWNQVKIETKSEARQILRPCKANWTMQGFRVCPEEPRLNPKKKLSFYITHVHTFSAEMFNWIIGTGID